MNPCETCALGQCGGAADEVTNRLKAVICASAGIPFFCHHDRNGNEYDWRGDFSQLAFLALPRNERKVCEGWKRNVAELVRIGHFDFGAETLGDKAILRRYQRGLGREALVTLDACIVACGYEEREERNLKLEDLLEALRAHRVYDILDGREWNERPPLEGTL